MSINDTATATQPVVSSGVQSYVSVSLTIISGITLYRYVFRDIPVCNGETLDFKCNAMVRATRLELVSH